MKRYSVSEVYEKVVRSTQWGIKNKKIFCKGKKYWKELTEEEAFIKIRGLYSTEEQSNISTACVKEVVERLRQSPELQICFLEEFQEKYLNLENGIIDVENCELLLTKDRFKFGYCLKFNYLSIKKRQQKEFENFCKTTFPEDTEIKRKLLLQILGYCISDYLKAKTGFFLIGESNSGKSVVLELLRRVLPEKSVSAIPLYRLNNRFNLGRLENVRVNICTELSENSFSALDIYKMLTSNEIITAENKGGNPFEFRLRCKSVNAGNMMPTLKQLEGMQAILNRMTILLFTVSVAKEKQDLHLVDKLWKERDSIFSSAVDELILLHQNGFVFEEPEDTAKLKKQMQSLSDAFHDFLKDECVFDKSGRVHISTLYEAFRRYCDENLLEVCMTRSQFVQRICRVKRVERKKLRIDGSRPLWGLVGIRLREIWEVDKHQDSESYEQKATSFGREKENRPASQQKGMERWNNGTPKEGMKNE